MSEAKKQLSLGVDLGGTKIETALVDMSGSILASHRCPTHLEKGPDGVIADIVNSARACAGEAGQPAWGMGIGVAGQVDRATGVLRFGPNLGWHNVPIQAKLEEALGMPVIVTNDVRAATYGEWHYGAGKAVDDLVCLFVGTGVGGGVVSGGRLLEGCNNTAGELGHVTIVAGGRPCRCPNRGCLEAYAGGWAIAQRAQEAVHAHPEAGQQLIALAGGVQQLSAETVTQAYGSGDPLARHLVEETAKYLAAGVVGIVNAFNPCLLVLGGGVIQGLPQYATMIEPMVRSNALSAAAKGLRIVNAALGDKAGVIGGAALVRDRYGSG